MFRHSITALFTLLLAGSAYGATPTDLGKTGLGVQIGTLSALTMRRTLNESSAWDVALGTQNEDILATSDYLWYPPQMAQVHPYIGVGAGIDYDTEENLGENDERFAVVGRIPLGVSYYPENTNLTASAQLTPMFETLGGTEIAAAVSLLYYFQ